LSFLCFKKKYSPRIKNKKNAYSYYYNYYLATLEGKTEFFIGRARGTLSS